MPSSTGLKTNPLCFKWLEVASIPGGNIRDISCESRPFESGEPKKSPDLVAFRQISRFAQENFLILLDMHTRGEQDHVEVSPSEARFPLRNPNAVSLKAKVRIER
jgi:hypothetical protein